MVSTCTDTSAGSTRKCTEMEWRIYKSVAARKSALTQLIKGTKYNYLVVYLDSRGPAIMVGNAAWVQPGEKYVDR